MVFSSHLFLFYFLPSALVLYFLMPRRAKHWMLTGLSYLFYGWANPLFVFLMFFSTLVDFLAGLAIAGGLRGPGTEAPLAPGPRSRRQKAALVVSICTNLALLGFFKYFNFGLENFDALLTGLGLESARLDIWLRITLPVGISFYTLQSMSYTIDVYRGQARAVRRFGDFACFVSMFPQLVAGPIIRYQEVADQLQTRRHSLEKFSRGAAFICLGLAKKVLLANTLGQVADQVFDAGSLGFVDAWTGSCAYTLQLYFDFSGYSDMAIGLGLILGFTFPKNFDSPLLAQSITEHWQRWHLSLSTFLRDYLYIPLGGNRRGPGRAYLNLWAVMLIGGLWHGAAWHFVVWGGIHAAFLTMERLRGRQPVYQALPKPLRIALTFAIVNFTLVAFRAEDLAHVGRLYGSLLGLGDPQAGAALLSGLIHKPYYLFWLALGLGVAFFGRQTWDYTRRITWPRVAVILGCFGLSIALLTTQAYNPFLYFIF